MDLIAKNISPAKALQALYDAAVPIGLGQLHARGPLTEQEAADLITRHMEGHGGEAGARFDYVHGRPLKVKIVQKDDVVIVRRADLLDRDAPGGEGSAQRALIAAGAEVVEG
jgi:hypothetical protein